MFFLQPGGSLKNGFPLLWEAVTNENHPKHKLASAAVPKTRNRQAESESDLQNKDMIKDELSVKSVKAVTEEKETKGAGAKGTLDINHQKAAADAINKVKPDLALKDIEQRLKQEKEKQKSSPCRLRLSEKEYFLGFLNMYSLDFCLISSGVGALTFDSVY